MTPAHTDRRYEEELKELRDLLLGMGGKVEAAIAASVRALVERDAELARKVKASDVEVNRLEVQIDDACRRLLALRQPGRATCTSSPPRSRSSPTSSGWATWR